MRRIVLIGAAPGMGVALTCAGFDVSAEADVFVAVDPAPPRRINFDAELAEAARELRLMQDRRSRRRFAQDERGKRHEWLQSLRRKAGGYA